jgi:hypothetical protein
LNNILNLFIILDARLNSFEKTFEYMEHLIEVTIESLKTEIDKNEVQLLDKMNKFIRSHVSNQKITKRVLFKINDHRKNKKYKINSKKIGFICLQINKKTPNDVWRLENPEEFVKKILNKIL